MLSVIGELDLAAAPKVRQALVTAVQGPAPDVVLDLASVDFIDSSGLGIVIGALKRVWSRGGRLRVVAAQPQVVKVFELTELDRILPLAASVEEAVGPTDG